MAGATAPSAAEILVAHKFPLALGKRPLASLSPGERVRAALIALFRRSPPVEILILDEPTYSLDRVGRHAMIEALRAFRGGLVVASHDRDFLDAIGIDTWIALDSNALGEARIRTPDSPARGASSRGGYLRDPPGSGG
jgi:ATPase subunit of ABC transporter with duplicated ATPase domains